MKLSDYLTKSFADRDIQAEAAEGALALVTQMAEQAGWACLDPHDQIDEAAFGATFLRPDGSELFAMCEVDDDGLTVTGSVPSPINPQHDRLPITTTADLMAYLSKPPAHEVFGARLVAARTQRSLTQTQLADLLNVTQATISRWESNAGTVNASGRRALQQHGFPLP